MEIELSAKAARQWKGLLRNEQLLDRIEKALDHIAANPHSGKQLEAELTGIRSYRVGDWRILYKVIHKRLVVLILSIAHRREVYR
jgi:mRNA interferase RelE/StbE